MRLAFAITLAACSSGKPKQIEDARRTSPQDSASPDSSAPSPSLDASAPSPGKPTTGDVQIRVEWPAMPLAARVSSGPSACGTPLVAQVSPTTTWGIPDVIVFVEGAPPASSGTPAVETRVTIDRCTVSPRVVVGSRVAFASAADRPIRASLTKKFAAADVKRAVKSAPVPIALPIAGHEVLAELATDSIYRVAPDGSDVGDGWIIGATAFVTDATGVALISDVPPGTHAVRVWVPPRGGQPARSARGDVTVEVGDLAELTLTLE